MLSTLRGSTSTRSRLPNTTCSTTPPKRSASIRASRSASSTSALGEPAGLEEAPRDGALELARGELQLLGAEQAGGDAGGRLDHDRGHVVGEHVAPRRSTRSIEPAGRGVVADLLEQLGEPLATEQAALGRAGLEQPVGEHGGDRARHQRHRRLTEAGAHAHADRRRGGRR